MFEEETSREDEKAAFLRKFMWSEDGKFTYLKVLIKIVALVSTVCAVLEILLGCWSLNILSTSPVYTSRLSEISSSKSKHVVLGVALFLTLSARITALIVWLSSISHRNLRAHAVTSHCTFLSIFVVLGLCGLLAYFLCMVLDFATLEFRPESQVLLTFSYVAGFDVLFSLTFGAAVASDLQRKLAQAKYECSGGGGGGGESWVRPYPYPHPDEGNYCHNNRVSGGHKWRDVDDRPRHVLEVYV